MQDWQELESNTRLWWKKGCYWDTEGQVECGQRRAREIKKIEHSQKRGATYVHTLAEALTELHCKRTECDFYGQNNPGLVNHQRQTHTAVTLHCSQQYKQKMMPKKQREILQANSRFHDGSQIPIPRSSFRSGLHHSGWVKTGHWRMDRWNVCMCASVCTSVLVIVMQ